ncbi:MAG: glycosyltransferase family 39 protein [Patescibacteria group bacterium]
MNLHKNHLSKQPTWVWLALIILVAIGLRFYRLENNARFIWDEGRDMLAIRRLIVNRDLTLFGPYNEIDGKKDFFGVFHYYLMAPALWASHFDPIGPTIFTAGLGVVSVLLLYFLLTQWTSPPKALLVTWLYAISPLVVKYVQWVWNPNTTPFFGLLYFLALTKLVKSSSRSLVWSGLAGLCLGLLFQLHYFTAPLVVVFLLTFFVSRRQKSTQTVRLNWPHLSLFFALAVLPNLSFVLFDLTHEFFYTKIVKEMLLATDGNSYLTLTGWRLVWYPVQYSLDIIKKLLQVNTVWAGIILAFLLYQIKQSFDNFRRTRLVSLDLWISLSWMAFILMTDVFTSLTNDYHSAFLWFGLLFLLVEKLPLRKMTLLGIGLLSVSMILGNQLNRSSDWSENMPLVRALSQVVTQDVQTNQIGQTQFNLATFTDADTRGIRYRYFLVKDGLEPSDIDQYAQDKLIYIITPHSEIETKRNPAWEIETVITVPWQYLGAVEDINVYRAEL